MDIETLDIYLAQAPGGYTAQATTTALGTTSPRPMPLNQPELLGSLSLPEVYAPFEQPGSLAAEADAAATRGGARPAGEPAPDNASLFVKALRELQRGSPSRSAIVTVGDGLYNSLPSDVRDLYNRIWGRVQAEPGKLLRVRLHFSAPELAMLPWEFLKIGDTFLGTRRQQSLIRYPEVAEPAGRLLPVNPLKVLIWAANPEGTAPLKFDQEIEYIKTELARGLGSEVQLDLVRYGGPRNLLDKLQEGYHVLHYIGHGVLDRTADPPEGKLLLERSAGAAPSLVSADQLAPGLLDNSTLQLVFLNSCEGATGSVTNAYASLAFNLARFVPAVIAMQYRVLDYSAVIFSQEFYQALSQGQPLDRCVTEGRNGLIAEYGQSRMDWGVPALFTRAITGAVTQPTSGQSGQAGSGQAGSGNTNVTISGPVSGQVAIGNNNTQTSSTSTPTTGGGSGMDGLLRRDLVSLLSAAFPNRSDIEMLTSYYLNTSLGMIPTSGNDNRSLFDGIVSWCLAQGGDTLARLIDGAISERASRNDLKAMRQRLAAAGLVSADSSGSSSSGTTQSGSSGSTTQSGSGGSTTPTQPTAAAPLLPPTEWPTLATADGGLRLTAQGRRLLTNTLANAVWSVSSNGRDQLLSNLPPNLRGIVRRDPGNQRVDLGLIIESVESFGQLSSGDYALIVLVDTAAEQSGFRPGVTTAEAAGVLLAFANGLRQKVGRPPVTEPLADLRG